MAETDRQFVVLPRRVIPQPTPNVFSGGDCGACALGGILGLTVPDAYARLNKDGEVTSFNHWSMGSALRYAEATGLADRCIWDMPTWHTHESLRAWGDPSWMNSGAWWRYLSMALDAGFYAITSVDSTKSGPLGQGTDHWVALCGARQHWQNDCGTHQVLISCSSRATPDEEWVDAHEFLQKRGGYHLFLLRPAESAS